MIDMSKEMKDLLKLFDNENVSIVSDGTYADTCGFIDTGSYSLNALFSGDIYGGIPDNKITAIAGEEATGKTYFSLSILKHFLDTNPDGMVILFESEGAISKDTVVERGLDASRVIMKGVDTIEKFKHYALKFLAHYLETPEDKRKPTIMVLDSLGMLSTSKEMADTEAGKDTKDMTRAQLVRAAFRVLTFKLSEAKIPFLVTNHVHQTMGMFPTKEMSGGGGLKYSASSIVALGKSKDKDSAGKMTGVVVRCRMNKGRLTREGGEIKTLLSFSDGLSRYYGLVDIALKHEIFKKSANKIELPNGEKVFEKHLMKNAEKYFTKEILDQINDACKKEFFYGGMNEEDTEYEVEE